MRRHSLQISPGLWLAPCLVLVLGSASTSQAQGLPPAADDRARRALVLVETKFDQNWVRGVGFLVTEDLVVTSTSAIAREDSRPTRFPAEISVQSFISHRVSEKAELVAIDRDSNLAFFRVKSRPDWSPLALGPRAPGLEAGQTVYVPQHPPKDRGPGAHSLVEVERSALLGLLPGGPWPPTLLQLPGEGSFRVDGAPVLNAQGELLGISLVSRRRGPTRIVLPARFIRRSLAGRPLNALVRGARTGAEGVTVVNLGVPTVDPARRIRVLRLEVWTRPKVAAGHSKAWSGVDLVWDELLGEFVGQIRGVLPRGHSLWVRRIAIGSDARERVFAAQQLAGVGAPAPPVGPDLPEREREAPSLVSFKRRNPSGTEFDQVRSQLRPVQIAQGAVLAVEAPADGAEVYAISENKSQVLVLDPVSLEPIHAIAVPRFPTDLWADDERLVVACRDAGVILTLDRRTRITIGSLTFHGLRDWVPEALLGRTPEGEFFSVWRHPGRRDRVLISQSAQGRVRQHLDEQPDPRRFAQGLEDKRAQLQPGRSARDFVGGFLTQDQRHKLVPHLAALSSTDFQDRQGVTFARTLGAPLLQIPGQPMFVAWNTEQRAQGDTDWEFLYVSRYTGEVVRKILVARPEPLPGQLSLREVRVAFVPRTERLVIWDSGRWAPKPLRVVPCGPVDQPIEPLRVRIEAGEPPGRAEVGSPVTFAVKLNTKDPKATVVFRLGRGPYGASVDPSDGTFRWTPTSAMVGQWDVEVLALVNGASVLVERWLIEVPKPPG